VLEQSYRLATYVDPLGSPRAGIVVGDRIIDAAAALERQGAAQMSKVPSVLALLDAWEDAHPRLQAIAGAERRESGTFEARRLSSVSLLAPVLYPGAIFCAGANYRDHVEEMSKALGLPQEPDPHELGLNPWHFLKAPTACVRATETRIALPSYSKSVDWEAEIAVVMGRECRDVGVN
jgi:2-keto-4-pentenoate hydratase/2-oxohepta-3-ene-1,7-dioic acid hydratase in catechol pathway